MAILIRKAESKLNTANILFGEEIYEAEKIIEDAERFLERIKEVIKGE